MLSQSYKNAQEKLLNLEKQLYYETIHNEKQRSIIEILKYIVNDNLDDETILAYLTNLQDESINQEYEKKYEIRSDLEEIKTMVGKKKNKERIHKIHIIIVECLRSLATLVLNNFSDLT